MPDEFLREPTEMTHRLLERHRLASQSPMVT